MALPNQSGWRLGNRYYYNRYGMRSAEVDSTVRRILGLGDSVIYGGVQTDQDSLATSLFTAETGVQMLNISAGSWGPDNCAAYLEQHGTFDAIGAFLMVSSHDAHDNMTFTPTVGVHVSYPDHQYWCAIAEVFCRYAWPRLRGWFSKQAQELDPDQKVLAESGIRKDGQVFNPGFDQLKAICDGHRIPLVVYLHAEQGELEAGAYNDQGEEIIAWCKSNDIPLIRGLDQGFTPADYRDGIHINSRGQRKLADVMEQALAPLLSEQSGGCQ